MRASKAAQRYASLNRDRPTPVKTRPHSGAGAGDPATQQTSANTGARTLERIRQRLAAREAEWRRRTALDLKRLADIETRIDARQAAAARRRWFVLGRLLALAAAEDDLWSDALCALIDRSALNRREARLLGADPIAGRRSS